MGNDYAPRGDAEFNGRATDFVTYADSKQAAFRLIAADMNYRSIFKP